MGFTDREKTGISVPEAKYKWDRPRKVKKWFSFPQATVLKYVMFKEKKLNKKNIMTRKKADLFLRTYFRLVMIRIISKGLIFYLPYNLGKFRLNKIEIDKSEVLTEKEISEIINKYEGELFAYSEGIDKGACFTIHLPWQD